MKQSSQFSLSVHILSMLYFAEKIQSSVTSESMAGSANTNPVVIRRLLSKLRKAGMVASRRGPSGGFYLNTSPENITLWDVFQAVENPRIFSSSYNEPNPACPVGRNIQNVLEAIYLRVDNRVEEELKAISLQEIIKSFPF